MPNPDIKSIIQSIRTRLEADTGWDWNYPHNWTQSTTQPDCVLMSFQASLLLEGNGNYYKKSFIIAPRLLLAGTNQIEIGDDMIGYVDQTIDTMIAIARQYPLLYLSPTPVQSWAIKIEGRSQQQPTIEDGWWLCEAIAQYEIVVPGRYQVV